MRDNGFGRRHVELTGTALQLVKPKKSVQNNSTISLFLFYKKTSTMNDHKKDVLTFHVGCGDSTLTSHFLT